LQRRIVINIDSLVLKGFRHEDRHAIAAALQDELAKVLAAPASAHQIATLGSVPHMRIGNVNVDANAKPHEMGSAAGNAVGKGLMK
jgi:hypothetical protein